MKGSVNSIDNSILLEESDASAWNGAVQRTPIHLSYVWCGALALRMSCNLTAGAVPMPPTVFIGEAAPPESPWALWYRRPAARWLEALPVGNGRLGAMVFGGVSTERLALNESTFW